MADNPIPTLRASKLTVSPNSSIPVIEVVSLLSSFLNPDMINSIPINISIMYFILYYKALKYYFL